jgi:glycosyltransferase involved in cell wall biosynthesis
MREIAGDAGILVDPYDVRDIKQAMAAVALNDQLNESEVARGRAVAQRFSSDAYKARLADTYTRVLMT